MNLFNILRKKETTIEKLYIVKYYISGINKTLSETFIIVKESDLPPENVTKDYLQGSHFVENGIIPTTESPIVIYIKEVINKLEFN